MIVSTLMKPIDFLVFVCRGGDDGRYIFCPSKSSLGVIWQADAVDCAKSRRHAAAKVDSQSTS